MGRMNMKLIICSILLGLLSFSPAKGQDETFSAYERHWNPEYEKIRVISYNIFNGFDWGKDEDHIERFVSWIRSQDPEILAMQELCGFT